LQHGKQELRITATKESMEDVLTTVVKLDDLGAMVTWMMQRGQLAPLPTGSWLGTQYEINPLHGSNT
jgi:hypothetical protein